MDHFKGKQALEHVIEARLKGKVAASEIHGMELPGHYSAAADAAKETALLLFLLWQLDLHLHLLTLAFGIGWLFWKTGRSALLGFSRLERLHRLIEEERWEIEHHRPQEKKELKALYAAKGFSGKLLDEVVEVLMADDNRLLQVMLEEELGLNLETFEHPLKQAAGALIGTLSAILLFAISLFLPPWTPALTSALTIALSVGLVAHFERNKPLPSIVWNLALAALAAGTVHFISKLLS